MNAIPLVDLKAQLAEIDPEMKETEVAVLERTDYIMGAEVAQFELDFAAWVGAEYCVAVANGTDALSLSLRALREAGIHYPVPCHLQHCLSSLGYRAGDCPVAEKLAGEILSLPLFPELSGQQQEWVAAALRSAAAGG